jgi:hypothetical protein
LYFYSIYITKKRYIEHTYWEVVEVGAASEEENPARGGGRPEGRRVGVISQD